MYNKNVLNFRTCFKTKKRTSNVAFSPKRYDVHVYTRCPTRVFQNFNKQDYNFHQKDMVYTEGSTKMLQSFVHVLREKQTSNVT